MTSKVTVIKFGLRGFRSFPAGFPATQLYSSSFSTTTTTSGGLNPRHRQHEAAGVQSATSLSVQAQGLEVTGARGSLAYRLKTNPSGTLFGLTSTAVGINLGIEWESPGATGEADAKATRALYAKVRDLTQQFSGGIFLGELHQTVALISRPSSAILKLTRKYLSTQKSKIAFASKKRIKPKELRKSIADDYLQWVFGVQPLLSDIKDGAEALARIIYDPPRHRFTATGYTSTAVCTARPNVSDGELQFARQRIVQKNVRVKFYGMFQEMARNETLSSQVGRVAALSGFNLRSFVPTVWELMPWSFVVDYFVNVGSMLEAVCTDTSSIKWLVKTVVSEAVAMETWTYDSKASDPGALWNVYANSGSNGGYTALNRTINRAVATVPSMEPRINFDQSGTHLLNLAALVLSRN